LARADCHIVTSVRCHSAVQYHRSQLKLNLTTIAHFYMLYTLLSDVRYKVITVQLLL